MKDKFKVQSWKLKNFWKYIAYVMEMYTENFAFQQVIDLLLFTTEFAIVLKK